MHKDGSVKSTQLKSSWQQFCENFKLSDSRSLVEQHQALSLKRMELKVNIESNISKIEIQKKNTSVIDELVTEASKLEDMLLKASQVVSTMKQPMHVKELALAYTERKKLERLQKALQGCLISP